MDTVLLTFFKTLKDVSVYSLYALLFNTIDRLLRAVRDSIEFKLAHLFHQDKNSFRRMFHAFEVYYITLAFAAFSIANYFIIPFVKLYTTGVTDTNYILPAVPILFVLINMLSAGRYPSDAMIHIAGHFKQTQASASIETTINLVISILLVPFLGIEGALIGTVVSSLFRTLYLILYVNKNINDRSPKSTFCCWIINFAVFMVSICMNRLIIVDLDSYGRIFGFCIPYAVGTVLIYFLVISLCMKDAFNTVVEVGKATIQRKKVK